MEKECSYTMLKKGGSKLSLAGEDRKISIMNLLNEKGKVIARELSLLFEVSTETIRRDLDELEKENKLKKYMAVQLSSR